MNTTYQKPAPQSKKRVFNPRIEIFSPFHAPFKEGDQTIATDIANNAAACCACTACTACR
jgi:hypothetical protein